MAYPKRTEFEKREFIAKVYNLLESNHETKKVNHLDSLIDIEKQYQVAQRYCREMGYTFNNVSKTPNSDFEALAVPTEETDDYTEDEDFNEDEESEETLSPQPSSDFDIATASDDEITEETEESDFKLNSMTAEEVQEHIQNHPSKSRYKQKQQNTIKQKKKERKRELVARYSEILECLQDIDDGIYRGDYNQAKRMINILDDYAERLHNLLDKVYVERTEKILKQLAELELVLGKEEIMRINDSIGAYVPITE